jgi:AraC-like DNA-binding protein/quercetin dioxygenase-like cupin family protein
VLHQSFLANPGTDRAFVWKFSQAIGGRRPPHFHIEPELNLVVRGSASFAIGSAVAHVSQGELLAFPSGQDHALLAASPDLYLYAIGLEPGLSREVLGRERASSMPMHVRLAPGEYSAIVQRAEDIVDRSRCDSLAAELWERSHWAGLHGISRSEQGSHVFTRKVMQLLGEAPELGLEELASQLRAQPSEVSRHFHRDMHVPFVRYRSRLRLLQFIRLVDSGEHDLMTSASVAGFGSYSQAHRSFHSEFGCGPRQFFRGGLRERMQGVYSPG